VYHVGESYVMITRLGVGNVLQLVDGTGECGLDKVRDPNYSRECQTNSNILPSPPRLQKASLLCGPLAIVTIGVRYK
jgi:hypothetical protein